MNIILFCVYRSSDFCILIHDSLFRRHRVCTTVCGPDGDTEALNFHLIRSLFTLMYREDTRSIMGRKRADQEFDFSEYLALLLNHIFLEQLEVSLWSWIAMVVAIYFLLFMRYVLAAGDTGESDGRRRLAGSVAVTSSGPQTVGTESTLMRVTTGALRC